MYPKELLNIMFNFLFRVFYNDIFPLFYPPTSSYQQVTLSTFSYLNIYFIYIQNLGSLVSAAHICVGVGHPPEHGKPTSAHILQ